MARVEENSAEDDSFTLQFESRKTPLHIIIIMQLLSSWIKVSK